MSAFMLSLKTQKSSKTRLLVPKNTGDNLPPTPIRLSVYGERLVYGANVVFLASQSTSHSQKSPPPRGDSGDGDGGKWRWQERLL